MSYTGDGNTLQYSVPFPYLKEDDVKVTVDGSAVAFSFPSMGVVALQTAPENGADIKIYRQTDVSEAPVDYSDGSVLLEADLDLDVLHSLYVAQEVYDRANDAIDSAGKANDKSDETAEAFIVVKQQVNNAEATSTQAIQTANTASSVAQEASDTANKAKEESSSASHTAQLATEKAETAIGTSNTAKQDSTEALSKATESLSKATESLSKATEALGTSNSAKEDASEALSATNSIPTTVTEKFQELAPDLIADEVNQILNEVEIPGLSSASITGALGYTPYDGDVNPKGFQTSEQVAQAVASATVTWDSLTGKPTFAKVATTGSYNDLSGKPTLATVATTGSYNNLLNKPTIPTVPTNVSSFVNDAGYITADQAPAPSVMTGATSTADGVAGLVTKPLAGDENKVLKGDGTWGEPPVSTTITYYDGVL